MFREGQMKFSFKDYSKFYVLSEAEYPSFLMSSVKKSVINNKGDSSDADVQRKKYL